MSWNRASLFRIRIGGIQRMSNRRLGKSPDKGFKITLPLILESLVVVLLLDMEDMAVERPHLVLPLLVASLLCFIVACLLHVRRKAPRSRWRMATTAGVVMSVALLIVPWLPFERAAINDMYFLRYFLISVAVMLVLTLASYLRLIYIRRRSQQEILNIRLRAKRRKTQYI